MRNLAFIFSILINIAVAQVCLASNSSDEAQLRQLVADITQALNQNNVDLYASTVADDVVALETFGEFQGKEALLANFRQAPPLVPGETLMPKNQARNIRMLAKGVASGINDWEFKIPGMPVMKGSSLWTAKKIKGHWKFTSWAVVVPMQMPPPK